VKWLRSLILSMRQIIANQIKEEWNHLKRKSHPSVLFNAISSSNLDIGVGGAEYMTGIGCQAGHLLDQALLLRYDILSMS
jgi:hypothetical protein